MRYLIQKKSLGGMPAQEFGCSVVEAVNEQLWLHPDSGLSFSMQTSCCFEKDGLKPDVVPVGSVEFCLAWYRGMGAGLIRPLNIPKCLWPMVKRTIFEGDGQAAADASGAYFAKDVNRIKAPWNGPYRASLGAHRMQFAQIVPDIVAEWRCFVSKGAIVDVRCYAGDPWRIPEKEYCKQAAATLGQTNPAFTLDVLVRENGETDLLECHDFFACGLYGFSDGRMLLRMLRDTQRHLLAQCAK